MHISKNCCIFAPCMDSTLIEDNNIDIETFVEEDGSVLMAAESSWRGFATELQELHYLKGAQFVNQLKLIVSEGETVSGKGSVGTQLLDSIGQSNRILLNITSEYNARLLAADIKSYFEFNRYAVEVLIFKGKKTISINRYIVQSPMFYRLFRKKYEQ